MDSISKLIFPAAAVAASRQADGASMSTAALTTTGLEMPDDFPVDPYEAVFKALGRTPSEAKTLAQRLEQERRIDKVFTNL